MRIINGNAYIASDIMTEAAMWLLHNNQPLWNRDQLLPESLTSTYGEENIYIGWENNESIAAMALIWHDPYFWPTIKENESGFIHKLSVRRKYAGKNYSKEMILFAESECNRRGIHYLRLDCAGERRKLCKFYLDFGFIQIDRKHIGNFDVALFEKCLC